MPIGALSSPLAHAVADPLKGFGRAYLWMLPGILLSWVAGGFYSGGWGLLTPLVFAGAAKARGLHGDISLLRLALQRAFSFIGIAVGVGLVFFVIGLVALWLAERLAPAAASFALVWFALFAGLGAWVMKRLWLAPALPFVVHEGEGGHAPFSGFLWVGPGMLSSFFWTGIPGQARKGGPVMVLILATLALYTFYTFATTEAGPAGSERLPLAVACFVNFGLMPLTIYAWVGGGRRAHRAALAYENRLGRMARGRAEELVRLPPQALFDLGIEADEPHWIARALRQGVDIKVKDSQGNEPLHRAAAIGSIHALATLIELGADPDTLNDSRQTPLTVAAESGQVASVNALAGQGADREGAGGRRPLCTAARARRRKMVAALLSLGAAVNPQDGSAGEDWPLLCAVCGGDAWVVERLLRAGARPPDDAAERRRLLREAAGSRDPEILRKIVALFDDSVLARELPDIRWWTYFQEADRPSGYPPVNAVLDEILRRLRPDTTDERYPWNSE